MYTQKGKLMQQFKHMSMQHKMEGLCYRNGINNYTHKLIFKYKLEVVWEVLCKVNI